MWNMLLNFWFSSLGRPASFKHQLSNLFHLFDLLPLVSSEYKIMGRTKTGDCPAILLIGCEAVKLLYSCIIISNIQGCTTKHKLTEAVNGSSVDCSVLWKSLGGVWTTQRILVMEWRCYCQWDRNPALLHANVWHLQTLHLHHPVKYYKIKIGFRKCTFWKNSDMLPSSTRPLLKKLATSLTYTCPKGKHTMGATNRLSVLHRCP